MWERLARLIDVKSIVTIILTGVFSVLAITGRVQADQFLTVFTVIIAFYFVVIVISQPATRYSPD